MKENLKTARSFRVGELTLIPFAGEQLMLTRVEAPVGSIAPAHSHAHEQMTFVEQGLLRFRLGSKVMELGPAEAVHVPGGVEHEAEILEEAVFYDIFHPVRQDFLEKLGERG